MGEGSRFVRVWSDLQSAIANRKSAIMSAANQAIFLSYASPAFALALRRGKQDAWLITRA